GISKKINIKRTTYAKYETGENQPDYEMLETLSDFFNVSSDQLLGRKKDNLNGETFNSLKELNDFVQDLGIDRIGFFDIEEWKNLSKEDMKDIKRHFEWIAHKAKERKQ